MPSSPPSDPASTVTSLRASFLGPEVTPRPPSRPEPSTRPAERTFPGGLRVDQLQASQRPVTVDPTPSAAEVLSATPALVRLCESYHRAQSEMTMRGRRQRFGIFVLVAAISVGALALRNSGATTATVVGDLVLALAGASCASVGLLALLWLRDVRRLRGAQGERLLRALQSSCSLPAARVAAFRRAADPVSAFFTCYETWRAGNARGGASGLIRTLRGLRA